MALKAGFFLVLLTPLLYQSTSLYPFLTIKVLVFQCLVELMLAAYLTLVIFEKKYRPKITPLLLTFSLFVFLIFLSGWWGVDWRASLWSFPERALGSFALLHFWALFLMLVGMAREIDWRKLFLFSFLISLVVASTIFFFGESERPGGVLGNPNFLSAYLLLNFFWALYFLPIYWRERQLIWVGFLTGGLIFQLLIIFIAQTRGVFLGLIAGIFLGLGTWLWSKKRFSVLLFLAVILLVGSGFWKNLPVLNRFSKVELQSALPRLSAWGAAWRGFQERPILGWGWENFNKAANKYYEPKLWRVRGGDLFFSKPHNLLIEYLISGGVLLLMVFLALVAAYFYESKDFLLWSWWLAYLIPNLFSFDSFGTYLILTLVLAMVDFKFKNHDQV